MRLLALLLLGWLLSGCALTVSSPRALLPIEGFVPLAEDDRVQVEPGYEDYALKVARLLPDAIARVEYANGRPFRFTPRVYVCGTDACFKRYVLTPKLSAAVVPDNRLILSPNLNGRESDRLEPLLIHELAHLHLGQEIGHYDSSVPIWFHEGWASLTANGGGAEFATDEEAYEAASEGRAIDPAARDTRDLRHKAAAFDLDIYEFYRQSMLLVAKLKHMDEAKCDALIQAIQANQDFYIAFWDIYGAGPGTLLDNAWAGNDSNAEQDSGAAAPEKP